MDKDEIKAVLKDVISSLIKDEADDAQKGLHDVLTTKMRDRITPPVSTDDDPNLDPALAGDD